MLDIGACNFDFLKRSSVDFLCPVFNLSEIFQDFLFGRNFSRRVNLCVI
jgi:hypothetical protein